MWGKLAVIFIATVLFLMNNAFANNNVVDPLGATAHKNTKSILALMQNFDTENKVIEEADIAEDSVYGKRMPASLPEVVIYPQKDSE